MVSDFLNHEYILSPDTRPRDFPMNLPSPENVVAIDFEASSLKGTNHAHALPEDSYPIEVGLAYANGEKVSHLIRPASDWADWDTHKEQYVHHIARQSLTEEGFGPHAVAQWLNQKLAGKTVICDTPDAKLDNFWNDRLFAAAGIKPKFKISYIFDLIDRHDIPPHLAEGIVPTPKAHRAGEDAASLMEFYTAYHHFKSAQKTPEISGMSMDI